jgi:hypothetical protein
MSPSYNYDYVSDADANVFKKKHFSNHNLNNEANNDNHRLSNNKLFNNILKNDSIINLKQDSLETSSSYLSNDFMNKRIQLSSKPYLDTNPSSTRYLSLLKNIAANTALINQNNSKTECSVISNKLFDKLNNGSNSYLSNIYSNKNNSQILFNKNKNLINNLKESSLNSSPTLTNVVDSCCLTDSSLINEPKKDANTNNMIINSNLSNLIYSCHDSDSGRHSMADSSNSPCSIVPLPPSSIPPDSNEISKKINSSNNSSLTGTFTSKCILSTGNQITFTQNIVDPKKSFSNVVANKSFTIKKSNQDITENKLGINNNSNIDSKSNTIRKSRNTINLEC